MKIQLKEITVRELYEGYRNDEEKGVYAYQGKLNVRPPYQREFIYKDAQRDAVIDTLRRGLPLNIFYWSVNEDGTFELMDGQQRTTSICMFLASDFSINYQYFHNLTHEEQEAILNYKLLVYLCEGTDKEKLDWFQIINIAGEELSNQELRNAVYSGPFVTVAKLWFSKTGCPAVKIGDKYISGSSIRQDYLQTALDWISNGNIEQYMAVHQHDENADLLWQHFQTVINWVTVQFPHYRKEMKGVDWGNLYHRYGYNILPTTQLETRIASLMADDDVTNKKGIYTYVLNGEEKHLSIRAFTDTMKRAVLTNDKKEYVHIVEKPSLFLKWKPTILLHGARADLQRATTAKCSADTAIEPSHVNNYPIIIPM